jgi:hypothetical protein
MKNNIKYWAKLIRESMDDSDYSEIINIFNERGYNCNEVDENLIEVKIGPTEDKDDIINQSINYLGDTVDDINKINDIYNLEILENDISYDHKYITGDEDNPHSYSGVYITVPISISIK